MFLRLYFFLIKFNFFTQLLVAGGLRVQHSCSFVSLLKPWVLASIEATKENFCMQAPMPSSSHHMLLSFFVLLLLFPVDWLRPYVNPVSHLCSRGRTFSAPFIIPSFLSVLIWSFPFFDHLLPYINFLIFHLKQIIQKWFIMFVPTVFLFPISLNIFKWLFLPHHPPKQFLST